MNISMKKKQTHRHGKQICGCQGGGQGGSGMDWEFGVSRCKLLHLEWINNKVLLQPGNYIQSPRSDCNGEECKKECIYIYIYVKLSHLAEQQKLALYFIYLFIYLFSLFRPTPAAHGGSQVRGPIGAVAAGLCQSHIHAGSKLHL